MRATFLQNVPVNTHTDALKTFEALGVPTKKVENWHYTDLKKSLANTLYTAPPPHTDLPTPYRIAHTHRIVIHNGKVSPTAPLPKGVSISGIEHIDRTSDTHTQTSHAMVALNTAHYTDGLVITITKNIPTPIHLAYVNGSQHTGNGTQHTGAVIFPRVQVAIADGVQAELIESYQSQSGSTLVNAVTEVSIGTDATLTHYKIQNDTNDSRHIAFTRTHMAKNAHYKQTFVCLNTILTRNEVFVDLNGTEGNADIRGIYITDATQAVDNTVYIRHMAENCDSSQLFKGILNDKSQGIFQGKIFVDKHAQLTDGYQMHRAILLSRDAEVDCKPELEIYADDVKCSHGASTGEIDQHQLFYLTTRGICPKLGRQMLLEAFIVEVLDHIENESLQDFLRDITLTRVQQVLT